MNDNFIISKQQDVCSHMDEGSSITGGKSVSEIVQLLRTKAKLKKVLNKDIDDEDEDDEPSRANQAFPWMTKFSLLCKEVIPEPSIKKLDELIDTFLKKIEEDVRECSKKPKRAFKLRLRMNMFLVFFHMIYWEIKKPLEHTSYLDKMSDILSLYIDVEIKSSRRGREHPKKISERICTSLYLFLDKSTDHILDAVLKSRFFIKKYSEICVPVLARLLKENPGQLYETTYVRYLLSFKLWKKLAGKEHYVSITKDAISKLKPPPDFCDKLKSGMFSNVLPYVSKSEKDRLTSFFMQSPFNVKKKAQLFLKDGRRNQTTGDLDKAFMFDDDFEMTSFFDAESPEDESSLDMMNDIWRGLVDKESDTLDDVIDIVSDDENETLVLDIKKRKLKEKAKKVCNDQSNNNIVKTPVKKHKVIQSNSNISVNNVSNKESAELVRTDKSNSAIISIASKEEISIVSCAKAEDTVKRDEQTILSAPHNNSDSLKPQKPCATVEPEKSKEIEPDSSAKRSDIVSNRNSSKPSVNCPETISVEVITHIIDDPVKNSTGLKLSSPSNPELIIVNPSLISESAVEAHPSETADSSGICEEVKADSNIEKFFVVNTQMYKEILGEGERLIEDQLVAEEVVIGTEISQDEGCSTTFLIMDGDGQGKLDHHDIMNVIDISKESTTFCSNSVVVNSDVWRKSQDKPRIQTEIVSLLENQNISLNGMNQIKGNINKEHSSVSPENHQFLSSIVASSESNDTGNYVSLDRRQDSYTYNDIMLTRLFSEVNADEGSDDDNRYDNRSRYAGGGKIRAFREQMEESKSDGGDEFESPSPTSHSDSQKSVVEAETNNSQAAIVKTHLQNYDQELKLPALNPVEGENIILSNIPVYEQTTPNHSIQIKEISFNLSPLSEMKKLNEYTQNVNDYIANKEKINSKGMSEPSPTSVTHFRTFDYDLKLYYLQRQLHTLYSTPQNVLDEPHLYPSSIVLPTPPDCYLRCPCSYCESNFILLSRNYNVLLNMRSDRLCMDIDKKLMLSKMYLKLDQDKMENDKLLKSIEENIPWSEDLLKESTKQKSQEAAADEETIPQFENNIPEVESRSINILPVPASDNVAEEIDKSIQSENKETRSAYASLPPKKRRAFSIHLDADSNQEDSCENNEVGKAKEAKIANVDCTDNRNETSVQFEGQTHKGEITNKSSSATIEDAKKSCTKELRVVIDKYCPLKIKAIDGYHHVVTDQSHNPEVSDEMKSTSSSNIPGEAKPKHEKCHKRHKRSKEERRLRKERKRLKRKMREERSSQ